MRIYKLGFNVDDYENIELCESVSADFYQMFDGTELKEKWNTPMVQRMEPEKKLELGNAPGFIIPVFDEKAYELLYPIICPYVEILPLKFENSFLYGINVTTVLDALDYSKSLYKTYRDGKRIMVVNKYSFKEEIIKDIPIFKIVDEKRRNAFISEDLYNIIKTNNLKGFNNVLVYESV